jgi:hypothetical protein
MSRPGRSGPVIKGSSTYRRSRTGVRLVELTGSAAGKRRAFAAVRQLRPWRNEPFVQDVQDRLLMLAS